MKDSYQQQRNITRLPNGCPGKSALVLTCLLINSFAWPTRAVAQSPARVIDLGQGGSSLLTIFGAHTDDTHVRVQNMDGYSEALASGDINGDGIPDILMGAPFAKGPDGRRANAGEVYVIFGRNDGSLSGSRDLAAAAPPGGAGPDVIIFGSAGASIGGVILAQDMNGDGVDDIILGAPTLSPANNQPFFGGVVIYFGSRDLASGTRLDLAGQVSRPPDLTYGGSSILSSSGSALAGGDVNGDGIADLLVGAPLWNKGTKQATGAAYLFLGAPGLRGNRSMAAATGSAGGPFASFAGADASNVFGQAMVLGDVNGDGTADLVIAAPGGAGPGNGRKGAGQVYVFLGSASLPGGPRDVSTSPPDILIYGGRTNDSLGNPLLVYDFNGDGSNDILIGAVRDGALQTPTVGAVQVIFGGKDLMSGGVRDLATGLTPAGSGADAEILGPAASVGFPSSFAAADFDGDGKTDLCIGSRTMPKSDAAGVGAAFIILGKSGLSSGSTLDLSADEPGKGADIIVAGVAAQDQTAFSMAGADLNKDGLAELLLTAPGADGPSGSRPNSGAVYVVTLAPR